MLVLQIYFKLCVGSLLVSSQVVSGQATTPNRLPGVDPNGYVLFCLCMGRYGNQLEHFLGGLAFAKKLNRTLLLPPLLDYAFQKQMSLELNLQKFTSIFKKESLEVYHRVMDAEDFIEFLAPTVWPAEKRYALCWQPEEGLESCNFIKDSPSAKFWDVLGVTFVNEIVHHLHFDSDDIGEWLYTYPASQYPVLAMPGAPAPYPMASRNRYLQQYLQLSEAIETEAANYINEHFAGEIFVGIHLRNGKDWETACSHIDIDNNFNVNFMASVQCKDEYSNYQLTKDICFPSKTTILRQVKAAVTKIGATAVYVATDEDPMLHELQKELRAMKVAVFHGNPISPIIDWAVLIQSDFFIGNCVSSFTSFVKRSRDVKIKPSGFFGIDFCSI